MKTLLTILISVVALGLGALAGIKVAGLGDPEPAATASAAVAPAGELASNASARRDEAPSATDIAADGIAITVYKSPSCGCCTDWEAHLEQNGFIVTSQARDDMNQVKADAGLPPRLASCHTAFVGDYVIEGHVPAADIKRLLSERPDAAGLTVPGMPLGSPGMEVGDRRDAYDVLLFQRDGTSRVFQHYAGS